MAPAQLGLFGSGDVAIDPSFEGLKRTMLPGPETDQAWFDYCPGWLRGHQVVLDRLADSVRWHQEQRTMYERRVAVPRLYAVLPQDGAIPTVLERARSALGARYGEAFTRLSLGYYRDGADSVAWHGDYVARRMRAATVATISVGAPRPFWLRPKSGNERISLSLGWGDLIVMGGSCQRTWEHAVPKQKRAAARIAIMFRPVWEEPQESHYAAGVSPRRLGI